MKHNDSSLHLGGIVASGDVVVQVKIGRVETLELITGELGTGVG